MTHGCELKVGNVDARGCAERKGIKRGKWDNCNSIINKYIFKKTTYNKDFFFDKWRRKKKDGELSQNIVLLYFQLFYPSDP